MATPDNSIANNSFTHPKDAFLTFQQHDAEINIKPFGSRYPGVYEIHEGYNLPGKAIWKVEFVYDNGIELIAVKTKKVKFISYHNIALIKSNHCFFNEDDMDDDMEE
jgi:hypothetical protein